MICPAGPLGVMRFDRDGGPNRDAARSSGSGPPFPSDPPVRVHRSGPPPSAGREPTDLTLATAGTAAVDPPDDESHLKPRPGGNGPVDDPWGLLARQRRSLGLGEGEVFPDPDTRPEADIGPTLYEGDWAEVSQGGGRFRVEDGITF
jgi:hypothetical protein